MINWKFTPTLSVGFRQSQMQRWKLHMCKLNAIPQEPPVHFRSFSRAFVILFNITGSSKTVEAYK
jgi:hypothetical protein